MFPIEFFAKAYPEALASGHVWPDYACCEAALESAWGSSKLSTLCNDLFGQKFGFTTQEYETVDIPTKEWVHGQMVEVIAKWPKFPDWATSFRERMELLKQKASYAAALAAPDGPSFVKAVSLVWATDPERANKVLSIHRTHWPQHFPVPMPIDPEDVL